MSRTHPSRENNKIKAYKGSTFKWDMLPFRLSSLHYHRGSAITAEDDKK